MKPAPKPQPLLNLRVSGDTLFEANLMTNLKRLAYDAETRIGFLDCGPNDLPGSIRIFVAIDPEVRAIISNDMIFYRKLDGEWSTARFPSKHWNDQRITLNPGLSQEQIEGLAQAQ